jgi:cytoplasmic iron level regulating protein YaaA (DUF328/UPF0246 family)
MNFKPQMVTEIYSLPQYIDEAEQLIELLKALTPTELRNLLNINVHLTQLNFERIFNWQKPFTPTNAKQAVLLYDGEVFRGLNAHTFTVNDFEYAQQHLRLLSGLYGVLRPLDLIQPYRLEVSSKLENPTGKELYRFWTEKVTTSVLETLKLTGKPEVILNLLSGEYYKTLDFKNKNVRVIDVEFYQCKNDKWKQIVMYTKKARGLMARYVLKNRIVDVEDLKGFSDEGYWFSPQLSTEDKLVFTR